MAATRAPRSGLLRSSVNTRSTSAGTSPPKDAGGCSTASCVLNNIKSAVNADKYGIILLHSTQPHTAAALQNIINFLEGKGFVFKTVEDAVKAKFGKSSGQLIPP